MLLSLLPFFSFDGNFLINLVTFLGNIYFYNYYSKYLLFIYQHEMFLFDEDKTRMISIMIDKQ
jgi:hypothetical protein